MVTRLLKITGHKWELQSSFFIPALSSCFCFRPSQITTSYHLHHPLQLSLRQLSTRVSNQPFQQLLCTVQCFPRFCFVVKNVGRQDDLANFWHFITWFQLFIKPIEFLGLNKVNWVVKSLKSCEKMSKNCEITLSADVFTTIENLGKL